MTMRTFNDKLFDLIVLTIIYKITKEGNVRPLYIAYDLCLNLEN